MTPAGKPTDPASDGVTALLVPGSYHFDNVGDIVMCQVAAERIVAAIPGARLRILATSHEALQRHGLGHAAAVDERPMLVWSKPVYQWLLRVRRSSWRALPFRSPRAFLAVARATRRVSDPAAASAWIDEVLGADLIVVCGQGALHDGSARRAGRIAAMVRLARAAGIPVVAVSQGIGPLEKAGLREAVAEALEELTGLGLRDGVGSVATVTSLGLGADRWVVTGDDAIARALDSPAVPGGAIGVSLRDNGAASVERGLPAAIGRAIATARPGTAVELVAMMEQPPVSDRAFLAGVVAEGSAVTAHDAEPAAALAALASCRVVVTGTYHAAVFAQSYGIPAICLASSAYYRQKMDGVIGQFGGEGGEVLDPSAPDFEAALVAALQRWWDAPDSVGAGLRAAAAEQVALGASFFDEHLAAVGAAR